jgi:hypothetical protein
MSVFRNAVLCAGFVAAALLPVSAQEIAPAGEDKKSFEFKDGDRLVLLGGTVLEREQRHATLEPLLALAAGESK